MKRVDGDVTIRVDENLPDPSPASSGQCRSGVPDRILLRTGYDRGPFYPKMVKIGVHEPEVWDNDVMHSHKLRYLHSLMARRCEKDEKFYHAAVENLHQRALSCYKHDEITEPKFQRQPDWRGALLSTMGLDAFFVIELLRKYGMKELRDKDDPIFSTGEYLYPLRRDLISIVNQLPLFVLIELFDMTKVQDDPRENLVDLALNFFKNMVGNNLKAPSQEQILIHEIKHLLGLVHYCLLPPSAERVIAGTVELELEFQFINYATELQESGIKFKKAETATNLLDIKFEAGEIRIPPLKVAESTFYLLENLIEYEKEFPVSVRRYVSDYAKFMQILVNSPRDVEVLRRSGVIENWLGNDEVIFGALYKLGRGAGLSGSFTYSKILEDVNEHCRRRTNVWMAHLWRNYFNSPWSLVSFVAALVLLLLTLVQAVFSVLSYYR